MYDPRYTPRTSSISRVNSLRITPDKSYMMFSHVIKGQPENMPLLQHVLDNNIELFYYECIVEGGTESTDSSKERKLKRLVALGKFAGRAGMTDALNPLGRRLS